MQIIPSDHRSWMEKVSAEVPATGMTDASASSIWGSPTLGHALAGPGHHYTRQALSQNGQGGSTSN